MECPNCIARPIVIKACLNDNCQAKPSFRLCSNHANAHICYSCGHPLVTQLLHPVEPSSKGQPPLKKIKVSEEKPDVEIKEEPAEVEEQELPTFKGMFEECNCKKVIETGELAFPIEIGNGPQKRSVFLGHSFHAMRAAEKALRKQCGIIVSGGSASGMNIALMELRLLLVDADCNTYEIAVQVCDAFNRNLLFCSTGGVVLTNEYEIKRLHDLNEKGAAEPEEVLVMDELKKRRDAKDKLIRCCASQIPYGGSNIFALCGGYSFFDPGQKTEEELNLAATEYRSRHDRGYRKFVGASDNDQLFHHSEQAGFKALFENPRLLVMALLEAFKSGSLPNIKLSLVAAAIDLFTTRSACNDCLTCSTCVLKSGHFFDKALFEVANFFKNVVTDRTCRIVRIDCEAQFKNNLAAQCVSGGVVLHGRPRKEQGAVPVLTSTLISCRLQIICNANNNTLLTSGSQDKYIPGIVSRAKERMRIMDKPDSIQSITDIFLLFLKETKSFHDGLVLAADLINKFCASTSANAIINELSPSSDKGNKEEARLAAKIYCLLRVLKDFNFDLLERCAIVGCASNYLGFADFEEHFLKVFGRPFEMAYGEKFYEKDKEMLRDKTKGMMSGTIEKLLQIDETTAACEARVLAIHYNVLDVYKKKVKEISDKKEKETEIKKEDTSS